MRGRAAFSAAEPRLGLMHNMGEIREPGKH